MSRKKKESKIPISPDGNQNPSPSKVNSRNKRPYRLIPVNKSGDFDNDGNDKAISKFYGPPTNCSDLSRLGYTLNGFYLVKAVENSDSLVKDDSNRNIMQVEAVSCMFKHPNYDIYDANNVQENRASLSPKHERIRLPNVASAGVHFRFRTKSTLDTTISSDLIVDYHLSNQVLLATVKLHRGDNISVQIVILDKVFTVFVRKFFQLHSQATFSGSLLEETD